MPFPPIFGVDVDKATPTALAWVAEEARVWMAVKLGPNCLTGKHSENKCPPAQVWNCDSTRPNACVLVISFPYQGKDPEPAYPVGLGVVSQPAASLAGGGTHVWVSLGNGTMVRCQATGDHACSFVYDAKLPQQPLAKQRFRAHMGVLPGALPGYTRPVDGQLVVAASLGAVFQLNSDATVTRCATSEDGTAACAQAYVPPVPSTGGALAWDEKGTSLLIAAWDNFGKYTPPNPDMRQTLRSCYRGEPPCSLVGSWGVGELGGITSVTGMQPATKADPYPLPWINSIVSDNAGTVVCASGGRRGSALAQPGALRPYAPP